MDRDQLIYNILGRESLPALSPLAVRLVNLAAEEDTSAGDLAEVIEHDPSLTARLLGLVNSPAYRRGPEEVASVKRAVVLLGMQQVRVMALSISLRETLPLAAGGQDYLIYWRSCLNRAVLAKNLAKAHALPEPEEAFVAGLVAEIGLPLLLAELSEAEKSDFPGFSSLLGEQMAWEEERLGLNHRDLGGQVLARWSLPERIVAALAPPPPGEEPPASPLAKVVDFARRGVEGLFCARASMLGVHRLGREWFGFKETQLADLLALSFEQAGQAGAAMEIGLNDQADLLAVAEKANQALSRLMRRMEPAAKSLIDPRERRKDSEETMRHTLEAVVHEIRNPLTSVGGFARRLAGRGMESQKEAKYLEVIVEQASRLDAALAEMQAMVRPYRPKLTRQDLVAILKEFAEALADAPPPGYLSGWPPLTWKLPDRPVPAMVEAVGIAEMVRLMIAYGARTTDNGNGLVAALSQRRAKVYFTISGHGSLPDPNGDPMAELAFGPELSLARARQLAEALGGVLESDQLPESGRFVLWATLPEA